MFSRDKAIVIYCIVDDILKGIAYKDDSSRKISDNEVTIIAIVSTLYFGFHMDNR